MGWTPDLVTDCCSDSSESQVQREPNLLKATAQFINSDDPHCLFLGDLQSIQLNLFS